MKRFLFALLLLSITSILADQPLVLSPRHVQGTGPIEIDGLVYSQPYSYENLLNGYSNYNGSYSRWVCDDFTLEDDYDIREICVWMQYTGGMPTHMNLVISKDDNGDSDPNTSSHIWAEYLPCTHTFVQMWPFYVWETRCTIPLAYPELEAGVHYYFETQADVVDNCFIFVSHNYVGDYCWCDDGSGVYVRSDVAYGEDSDMFFEFIGEPLSTLEPETWGSIKTLF